MTSFAGQIAMAGLLYAMVFVVQDPASAQPGDPRDGTTQRNGVLARAVELLIADAKLLDKYNLITLNEEDKSAYQSHLSRPHPALSGWGGDEVPMVLKRMIQPFTSNAYRDTYIRWHLMWVVKQAEPKQLRKASSGLLELVEHMPPPINLSERPEWRLEPEEIGSKYYSLIDSISVIVGIPPFDKRYEPPGSFDYMTSARKAEAETIFVEARALRDQFKVVTDEEAKSYNQRVRFVNWAIRQYRGELIYALVWTGDPKVAQRIVSAIDRHSSRGSGLAVDLLNFLYQGAFEGALDLYEPHILDKMRQQLLTVAKREEGWGTYGGQQRNFADYAFHMIQLLEEPSLAGVGGYRPPPYSLP
ncbi:MAG: hypothetical protein CMJ20_05950 [Phycisphaeraceae bacterium]|nr:hypothetical protein [Phycisphaeraceae bacterium]